MKNVRLQRLTLKSFMGVKDFVLDVRGHDAIVRGQNGTGKTSCKHALNWLLTGKDASFGSLIPKPKDDDGYPVHNIDTVVEGEFVADDKVVTLKRLFREKWTKKRGSLEPTFTGHEQLFWVSEVPVKASDYKAAVAEIFGGEASMKALVDPFYVCEKMPWAKRRELLLDVCGNVADDEVFASDPDLNELKGLMGDHDLDSFSAILKDRMQTINKRLKEIPARIDELKKFSTLPDDLPPKKDLLAKKKELNAKIRELQGILSPKSDDKIEIEKQRLQLRLDQLETQAEREADEAYNSLREELRNVSQSLSEIQKQLSDVRETEITISNCEAEMSRLRAEYKKIAASTFSSAKDRKCPTCGQDIPVELQREAWNAEKAQTLKGIQERGKELAGKVKTLKATVGVADELRQKEKVLTEKVATLQARLNSSFALSLPPEYKEIEKKLAELEKTEASADTSEDEARLIQLKEQKIRIDDLLYLYTKDSETKKRIKALEEEEKALAGQWQVFERQKYLVEKFIRARVQMLEGKVIETLDIPGLSVKLFEEQINSGLRECCELTFDGIPWNDGLNYGAKVFVGLCLISKLQYYYGISMPIMVDNAESLTWVCPFNEMQIIWLQADEECETLTVEVKE